MPFGNVTARFIFESRRRNREQRRRSIPPDHPSHPDYPEHQLALPRPRRSFVSADAVLMGQTAVLVGSIGIDSEDGGLPIATTVVSDAVLSPLIGKK